MYIKPNLDRFMLKQADKRQVRDHQIRQFISDQLRRWGGLSGRPYNKPWTPKQLSSNLRSSDIAKRMLAKGMHVSAKEVAAVKRTMKEFAAEALIGKKVLEPGSKKPQVKLHSLLGGIPSVDPAALSPRNYLARTPEALALEKIIADADSANKGPRHRARINNLTNRLTTADAFPARARYTASRAAPYARAGARAGGAVLMPLLSAAAINDTKKHWTPENFGYTFQEAGPWLETARTAAGLSEATPDMFDEVGSGAFWKALPGAIGTSAKDTGAAMANSIGRLFRDAGKGIVGGLTSQGESLKENRPPQSASYDTIGQTKVHH